MGYLSIRWEALASGVEELDLEDFDISVEEWNSFTKEKQDEQVRDFVKDIIDNDEGDFYPELTNFSWTLKND